MADGIFDFSGSSWKDFQDDPLPGWARRAGTLFDVPCGRLESASGGIDVAVCSIPWDTTASTRIGSRTGPAVIREASLGYAAQARSRRTTELLNLRSGLLMRPCKKHLVDFGDLHVYPSDPEKQLRASAAEVMAVGLLASQVVVLGGEHTISHPVVAGLQRALREKDPGRRLGYLQIDHHFDFGDVSVLHGRHYHGSNARRVLELPGMQPETMGFVGMGDLTSASQYQDMLARGIVVRTMTDIRARGFAACLSEACDALLKRCDTLYVSIDIDVCDASAAPGTGHVTIGGISTTDFLAIADVIRRHPVFGLDIVEVNGQLDSSGVTSNIAARFLFELLLLEESSGRTL